MKISCSSENDPLWMFLGQEAKGREEVPLSKIAQKIRRMLSWLLMHFADP